MSFSIEQKTLTFWERALAVISLDANAPEDISTADLSHLGTLVSQAREGNTTPLDEKTVRIAHSVVSQYRSILDRGPDDLGDETLRCSLLLAQLSLDMHPNPARSFAARIHSDPQLRAHVALLDAAERADNKVIVKDLLKGKRVLMVDDQQVILDSVKPILEYWGMIVETTTSSKEARERLLVQNEGGKPLYDLLITDLKMPEVTGVDLLNTMIGAGTFIPTLVLSGSQANRQAAVLNEDLTGDFQGSPVSYLKKTDDDFEIRLRKKLERLARSDPLKLPADETLAFFKDILKMDEGDGGRFTVNIRNAIISLVDAFVDLRFAFALKANPLVEKIKVWAELAETDPILIRVKRNISLSLERYRDIYKPTYFDLVRFSEAQGWHDYKGIFSGIRMIFQSNFLRHKKIKHLPDDIYEAMQEILKLLQPLINIASQASVLRSARTIEKTTLKESLGSLQFKGYENFGLDFGGLESISFKALLILPDLLPDWVSNANQAMPPEAPKPVIRGRFVTGANLAEGPRWMQTEDEMAPGQTIDPKQNYLYVSVVNQGTVPKALLQNLRQGNRFTTKEHGTGLGTQMIRALLNEARGWPVYLSHDGWTEMGAFIPVTLVEEEIAVTSTAEIVVQDVIQIEPDSKIEAPMAATPIPESALSIGSTPTGSLLPALIKR